MLDATGPDRKFQRALANREILPTDGGVAVVMVRADRAEDFPQAPVHVLGSAAESSHRQISQMKDSTVTAAREPGQRALAAGGVAPSDIQVVELYDAVTDNTVLFREDRGHCAKGEGGAPGIRLKDVDLALVHGDGGGVLSSQVTAILGSQNTL